MPTDQSVSPLAAEGQRAKAWRERNRYTKRLLSQKTGFSVSSIDAFEAGHNRAGQAVVEKALRRYRLCCAAVAAGLDESFSWD